MEQENGRRTDRQKKKQAQVGVNSFSQFWSVLSPSRLVSFRSLFSRFTLSKYERLGERGCRRPNPKLSQSKIEKKKSIKKQNRDRP
jgi:hypothetical protein